MVPIRYTGDALWERINRADLPAAITALERVGFIFRQSAGVTMFLDGPNAKARDAVNVVFAGQKVRDEYFNRSLPLMTMS